MSFKCRFCGTKVNLEGDLCKDHEGLENIVHLSNICPDLCQNKDIYCYKCVDKSELYRIKTGI